MGKKKHPGIGASSFTRLKMIAKIIENVDSRRADNQSQVLTRLDEIEESEVNEIYALATDKAEHLERN